MAGKNQTQKIIKINARGVVKKDKLDVGYLCMSSPETYEAWEMDYNQQSKDAKTGDLVQFVSTLNKKPLKIFKNRPEITAQSILSIAKQEIRATIMEIETENQKKSMLLWLGIFLLALLLLIGIIILSNMGG